ncbi:hypothetical protein Pst134EA_013756 [Puccinia striiformis f. sp. tritici]|uniref:hypothetical protein n=1 Tax=Puccinia striiformis f. sp. tritici TaxID=168172 RepID=UPI0020075008|nr:hypothetical protein Pst134EA_013756 [Puccinia striiformis f. sp. tritici]KAH9465896.1 hypothetical protein Pst134EA_013756 [Puccinia striiformis f. sp. tritici]
MDEKMFMKSLVNRLPHLDDCFTLGVIQRPAKAMVKLLAWSGCEFYGPLGELHPDTPPQNNIFRCDCECPTARHGFNPIKFNDQMTDGPSHHIIGERKSYVVAGEFSGTLEQHYYGTDAAQKTSNPITMFPAVYVACLLVATAIASPVHHEARGFSSYSQDSAQSARNHGSQASVGPFGGSMSSHDDASSATSHNSGSTMIGGGVGGFGSGGGFGFANTGGSNSMSSFTANSMSAANSFSAGGIGGGVGGFGMNQQNSFSASSAISNFQNVNSMMAQMQSTLMSGSMSSTVAYQSMLQLAQSFQIAMTQATACTSCFAVSYTLPLSQELQIYLKTENPLP